MFYKIVFVIMFFVSLLFAQTNEELITCKKSDLPEEVLQTIEMQQKISLAKKVTDKIGFGHEVGTAFKEGLNAITTETAQFAETKVGKFTMFMIAWKIMYKDIIGLSSGIIGKTIRVCLGIVMLIVSTIICIWSYRKLCIPRKILIKEEILYGDKANNVENIDTDTKKINIKNGLFGRPKQSIIREYKIINNEADNDMYAHRGIHAGIWVLLLIISALTIGC